MEQNLKFKGFTLDPFQTQAIEELDQGHSLVLSAPTGSGKTLIAEYLIEKVLKTDKRIIYTSPIKALSNQKYRDFSREYGDKIGILTGDVVINRDAQALIVTTEVYRNMAIEDPEAIADVSYVVFDEIHYLGDIERGTVWEESIIFSPKTVRFLALSATIPNCAQLAAWIESVIDHKVSVISHNNRAVPLSYIFFYNRQLLDFKELRKKLRNTPSKSFLPVDKRKQRKEGETRHFEIIRQLRNQDRLPLLYFVFSRALADKYSQDCSKYFDFTSVSEKKEIEELVDNCIEKYNLHNLETAGKLKEELMVGVGRHHAGLMPQLKELVEILFAKRIVKVLFVTETFAVGVNMPARSVAYDALKKYDGRSFRPMQSLEFCQISGRAGRRGIDETGYVVVPHISRDLSFDELQTLVYGDIEYLESQFDLSFNSVLNLFSGHKSEEVRLILKRNFAQFQANGKLPEIAKKVAQFREELEHSGYKCHEKESDLDAFMELAKKRQQVINTMNQQFNQIKGGLRGRKGRQQQAQIKKRFSGILDELKAKEEQFFCGKCKNKGKCISKYNQAARLKNKLNYWKNILEEQEELQLPIYERKLEILRQLGYLDDRGLLARGEIASRIHIHEIAVTELYFQGYFHECDNYEINALCLALIYEHRRRPTNGNSQVRLRLPEKIKSARGYVNSLVRQYPFIEPIDPRLSEIMIDWSKGEEFENIMRRTDLPEGDLIRAFRQTIDLIKQIRDAIKDQSLKDKLLKSIDLINRDIILATELRD